MENQYPTLRWIVENGTLLARAVGALPLLGAVAAFLLLGTHWLVLAAGLAASGVLLLIMKSYVELVAVICDMLLPK